MADTFPKVLDPTVLSEEATKLQTRLLRSIIGQERAVTQFVKVFSKIHVGLQKPNRPTAVFLFMGPTGVGKTELARVAAEALLGNKNAVTRIDCSEFGEHHEVSKLIGSPPGYVGYGESRSARLSQENIDKFQTPEHKINFVLFDEIEDAHDALHSAILQILDAGRLTLGTGAEVDFSKTIVIMTSNLGEKETQLLLTGKGIGLAPPTQGERIIMDSEIYKVSKAAATKKFKPKFMNRIDRVIVFRSLSVDTLRLILKKELEDLEFRIRNATLKKWEEAGCKDTFQPFVVLFTTTKAADDLLLKEGTSQLYGARELNRTIERFVEFPLANLMGSKQIVHGDILEIDYKEGEKYLLFRLIGHRDIKPLTPVVPPNSPSPIPKGPVTMPEGPSEVEKELPPLKSKVATKTLKESLEAPKRTPFRWR